MAIGAPGARFDVALLVLRLCVGLQMAFLHGQGKLENLLGNPKSFADPLGIGWRNSLIGAVLGEFVCGLLLAAGLFGRAAAAGMAFTMGVAAFIVHGSQPWGKKELALVYFSAALVVLIAGPGRWSFDHLMWPRVKTLFGRKKSAPRRRVEA